MHKLLAFIITLWLTLSPLVVSAECLMHYAQQNTTATMQDCHHDNTDSAGMNMATHAGDDTVDASSYCYCDHSNSPSLLPSASPILPTTSKVQVQPIALRYISLGPNRIERPPIT